MSETLIFGVLGHQIGYSQSPEIFKAISDIHGFEHSFVFHDIDPSDFAQEFPRVLTSGINGFSVTIPHKKRVMPYLDELDTKASQIGAVNSICVKQARAYGFSTDGDGFKIPLLNHTAHLKNTVALIFGAGGAAGAVVHCLANVFRIAEFYVIGRDIDRVNKFCLELGEALPEVKLHATLNSNWRKHRDVDYSLLVNCTPLGGWNYPDRSPVPEDFTWLKGRLYYDLSYNDANRVVEMAHSKGLIAFDGSFMLIGQAIRSYELWTGRSVDFEPVYRAVFGHRQGQSG
ncbi:MAG: hypothetical protein JSV52_11050 [Candidatus Zixiibacteriota bacterium]|nr:MAG: hypothetical protein JSV52_11050 [candidate division Zixibacteria bacterium]